MTKQFVCVFLAALMCAVVAADAVACPGSGPNLTFPGNNTQVPFGGVTLDWDPVPSATGYQVWIALDGDTPSMIDTTALTQKFLVIEPGRSVQWKITATETACTPMSSPIFNFTTSCPSGTPNITGPQQGSHFDVGEPITFNWTGMPMATSYDVQVTPDFGQTFQTIAENIATTSFTTSTLGEGDWGWTVRANYDGECGPFYAEPSSFIVGSSSCDTPPPTLIEPANGATNVQNPVTFRWSAVPNTRVYRLFIASDNGQAVLFETTTATQVTKNVTGKVVGWTVQADIADNCPPVMAEGRSFSTTANAACPTAPGKPTLIAPAANATNLVSPVAFSWNAVPGATSYRLLGAINSAEPETLALTTATNASVRLPSGTGFWLVQANFGEDCPATFSERRTFTVTQGAACNTTPPQLLSPANNTMPGTQRVTFRWSAVVGATAYELWVATGGDNDFAPYGTTDANTTELDRFVPNDIVDWYVVARLSGCPDVRSATFRFGAPTACILPAGPVLTSPANNAEVTSPVTLTWNGVQNATEYRITIKSGESSLITRTTNTSTTVRLPAGTFAWRVEALRGECTTESSERTFIVRTAANCDANTAPTLIGPLGPEAQPAKVTSPVTLQWNAAPNAIAYRVWISYDGQPFEDVALTTATSTKLELGDPGKYSWFVSAIFEGCEPKRSAVAWFEIARVGCPTLAPAIISPAANQTVNGRVLFQWGAVPGAEKYRVILIVDGEPKLLGSTDDTRLERLLQPGTYTYTIEAVFKECRSTFAPRVTFVVEREQLCAVEAPGLLSPANGATVTDPEVTFVWTPVSGAIKYAVIARVDDGTETLVGTTEETTLTRLLPQGDITWRVIAFFAGCDSQSSPRSIFTVPAPQGSCTNRKPVLLFPKGSEKVPTPVKLTWLGVPKANEYRVWIQRDDERPSVAATTSETFAEVDLGEGTYTWFVEARFEGCPPTFSARGEFTATAAVACGTPRKPDAQVVGRALSGTNYNLRWMPLPQTGRYEVQESTSLDFANALTFFTDEPFLRFSHIVTGAPVQYLYRVRGLSACNDTPGPFSDIVGIYIINATTNSGTTELGSAGEAVVQRIFVPGGTTSVQFSAKTDKPWLMVTPTSGTLPPEGITLTVTADPSVLNLGTNTGTVQLTYANAIRGGGGIGTNDGPTQTNFPMSVSVVTPVMPDGKGAPPPDSLIFPAVGHAPGANDSLFQSDTRMTNLSARTMIYDLFFTPSGVSGTENGSSTTIEVAPGETVALDDVVANLFGVEGSAIGMLEVRPVETSDSSGGLLGSVTNSALQQLHSAASSRTYNFTSNGTFGQFIPAIPFARFVGRDAVLSLQQVAQSPQFRANFGFLEASGNPVELIVRVFDTSNTLLTSIPLSLQAMEHRQINGMLQQYGINDLTDGRVEIEVTGGDGKVSAYVSEVDNATNDPLMVSPVVKGATRANRYVVPGMASLRSGSAFWVSDLRIFNGGTAATPATLTFYPMGNPSGAISRDITLAVGEIEVLNNVLVNLFGISGDMGGSIVITTPAETSLTATARTYNQTSNGTYGQFIPGVTVAESIGLTDRALQILQVEQSSRFRTNIGVNETSGKPVVIEVSLITPDSLVTPFVTIGLAANEFRQIGLVDFAPDGAVYNGRVTVKVIEGEGKVTAYGSAIDAITQDPTYVPAQ